jgi:hypothetical protein
VQYGYDDAGRLSSIAFPNGITSTYGHDTAGCLNTITHAQGGTTLAGLAYGLDNVGNRTSVTEIGVPLPGTTTYG